mmetsp:Transcript_6322/g.21185  ORF Transcript_6322/g.21185 Transcript_6322/m.21185 type:complete len:279 (+) Transcript_6322:530-1366(+)
MGCGVADIPYPPNNGGRGGGGAFTIAGRVCSQPQPRSSSASKSINGGKSIVGWVSRSVAPPTSRSVAAAKSSSLLHSSNGLLTAFSTNDTDGLWCDEGGPKDEAMTDAIASLPPSDAKSGSLSGSSRNEKLPPRPSFSPAPLRPRFPTVPSPPSSMNAVFIAGRALASANAWRRNSCSIDISRALLAGSPPALDPAIFAAMKTLAPCSKCASTATSVPTCATSRCHCSAAKGGFLGSAPVTTSSAFRKVLPSCNMCVSDCREAHLCRSVDSPVAPGNE